MVYKIGVYNKKSEIKEIDFSKITIDPKAFQKLEILDKLTMAMNNEKELMLWLLEQDAILPIDLNKKIKIVYNYRGEIKILPIFYSDSEKYMDEFYLKNKLKSKGSDFEFLEKLANHYNIGSARFNKQLLNVNDIRLYLGDVRSNGGKSFYSKILDTALDSLFEIANKNYRGKRDLANFIYNYEVKLNKIEKENHETKLNNLEQNDIFKIDEGEQLSLFDQVKKITLSSEGEPDFPPNSEEEQEYLNYLEELNNEEFDIENHDHYRR